MTNQIITIVILTFMSQIVMSQDTIPFELENNHVLFKTVVNNVERKVFLDLGSRVNVFPSNWVKDSTISLKKRKVKDADGNMIILSTTKDISFRLGNQTINNNLTTVVDSQKLKEMNPIFCCSEQFGIIGIDPFIRWRKYVLIDFKNQKIIYGNNKPIQEEEYIQLKMSLKFPFPIPVVKLIINGILRASLHLDTGYSGGLALKKDACELINTSTSHAADYQSFSSTIADKSISNISLLEDIRFESREGDEIILDSVFVMDSRYNLLGMDFFLNFSSILFDYQDMKLWLSKTKREHFHPIRPLRLYFDGANYSISGKLLHPKTENFNLGQKVYSINGFNLNNIIRDECCKSTTLDSLMNLDNIELQ